jgi:paraquat-inducible protein B
MSSPESDGARGPESFPVAEVVDRPSAWRALLRWVWLPLLVAALLIGWLAYTHGAHQTRITVHFAEGHGIEAGHALRYLGTPIGRVHTVTIDRAERRLRVVIDLESDAEWIARAGSRFWIARPQLSLTEVQGLETLVGDSYLEVLPGPADRPRQLSFEGLERPPRVSTTDPVTLEVRFEQAHRLTAGDPVRFRGLTVGEVSRVRLMDDLSGVVATLALTERAERLARRGSIFWIARPEVSLTRVEGLETTVLGPHVEVLPGPASAPAAHRFTGRDDRPPRTELDRGGQRITLEGPRRGTLRTGSAVYYRQMPVGRILSVGLSGDASRVTAELYIEGPYTPLLRTNTRFWSRESVAVDVGWGGLKLDLDPLSNLALGGVNLGLPDPFGQSVEAGHIYRFHLEPEPSWTEWAPGIPLGELPEAARPPIRPRPARAQLEWESERLFGGRERDSVPGHLIPLPEQRYLATGRLARAAREETDPGTRLRIAGQVFRLEQAAGDGRDAVILSGPAALRSEVATAPADVRAPTGPESLLLIPADPGQPIAVTPRQLRTESGGWPLEVAFAIPEAWDGAAAVARADGALIGGLALGSEGPRVIPLTETQLTKPPIHLKPVAPDSAGAYFYY